MRLPKSLIDGHWRFRRAVHAADREHYAGLAKRGQAPIAMVIACCDARVDVSAIFSAEAGDLFIMRNVANLVPPYEPTGKYHGTSAAIEYAALVLKVPHIIVLGHSHCGGVQAYREGLKGKPDDTTFIGPWLTLLDGLDVKENEIFEYGQEAAFELAAIRQSLANLRTFPVIRDSEATERLALHGLYFDIASGELLALDGGGDHFVALPES
ncbi:MAG TPA: carbonic anhydrase [Methyloceanibacter sp.]|nr:carbonic anhydrase [Methyloceanibacter sp.]